MAQTQISKQRADVSPAPGNAGRRTGFLREVILVALGYFVYSQVRGLAGDRVVDAFANGSRVVSIERDLGIFKELALQTQLLSHAVLIDFFNFIYFYGLFPLLLPTAIWLYLRRPRIYTLARNAFLASGAIAAIFFLLIPTAPPRLMGLGITDTLGALTPSYSSIPGVNHFAAVPSMHVGWNFLTALSIFLALPHKPWRYLIVPFPVVMFTATIVTGNHYFLDGVMGILVASAGLGVALLLERLKDRRLAASLVQAPTE